MILTNEEIMQINQTAEFDSALGYARKIEQAVLESYKAELLKEAGDPVLYAEFAEDGGWLGDASEYQYLLEEPHALYTSDQLVAAVLKATKPLEERRCEICGYAEHHREHTGCLRTQLTTAREEIDQLRQRVQELEKQRDELLAAIEKMLDALVISVPMAFAAAIQNMDIEDDDAEEIHAIGAALAEEIPDDGRTVRETLRFLTTVLSIAQSIIASVKGEQ